MRDGSNTFSQSVRYGQQSKNMVSQYIQTDNDIGRASMVKEKYERFWYTDYFYKIWHLKITVRARNLCHLHARHRLPDSRVHHRLHLRSAAAAVADFRSRLHSASADLGLRRSLRCSLHSRIMECLRFAPDAPETDRVTFI